MLQRQKFLLGAAAAVLLLAALGIWWMSRAGQGCTQGPGALSICALHPSARPTADADLPPGRPWVDLEEGPLALHAARNEVVSFQLGLSASGLAEQQVSVQLTDLTGPDGALLEAQPNAQLFLAHFVQVDPGGYTWGPQSQVLPWPERYPDALIPFRKPCQPQETLIQTFPVPAPDHENQLVWVDLYVPPQTPPGQYQGQLQVKSEGQTREIPLRLQVWEATLPHTNSVDAFTELYQAYSSEGIQGGLLNPAWRQMARCYQQLAHQHRVVFAERFSQTPGPQLENPEPDPEAWANYDDAYHGALSGELFSAQQGYHGPGQDTPVSVWRTPWPQVWNEKVTSSLRRSTLYEYEDLARAFTQHVLERGWTRTRLLAYLFDEVDGGTDEDHSALTPEQIKLAHEQMRRVQLSLDLGSPEIPIDLLWTSHADPSAWTQDPELDLRGTIRLWAPNAAAARPDFLQERAQQGERAWFYHAGHPHVGLHTINASGLELRTWGLLAARYQLQGNFIWAADLGDPEAPWAHPSYRREDDRFGNGTLVYPGARLDRIGHLSAPGPIPSMRLKAWRRGLQDAELAQLARSKGHAQEVDQRLKEHIPAALAEVEAGDDPTWPQDAASWDALRLDLLRWASQAP